MRTPASLEAGGPYRPCSGDVGQLPADCIPGALWPPHGRTNARARLGSRSSTVPVFIAGAKAPPTNALCLHADAAAALRVPCATIAPRGMLHAVRRSDAAVSKINSTWKDRAFGI